MYFIIIRFDRSICFLCKYGKNVKKKPHRFPITIFHSHKALRVPRKELRDVARQLYAQEKIPQNKCVHLILCSDFFIKKLNARFRNKPYPTDVLSFNYDEKDFLGEIYISLQRGKIQAKRYSVSYSSEIKRLFIHGMFHLLGFDHEKPVERNRMEAKERKYIDKSL
jgi:probable rRNA maturation factor